MLGLEQTAFSQAPTVHRIVESAIKEFGEKGEEFAKIENIAARAGISKQLIYYYYKTKKELYDDAINYAAKIEHSKIFSVNFDAIPEFEAVKLFFSIILTSSISSPHLYVATEAIHRSGNGSCPRKLETLGKQALEQLERIVSRGRSQGLFKPDLSAPILFFHMTLMSAGFSIFRAMMSNYLGEDFQGSNVERLWRDYAVRTIVQAVSI